MRSRRVGRCGDGRNRGETAEFGGGEGSIVDGHPADPAGESDAAARMDHAADRERSAAGGVGGCVDVVRIPPGIESQRRQLAVGLNPLARGRTPQRHPQFRERILPQFHPLVVALTDDGDRHRLILRRHVKLRLWEDRIFPFLHPLLPPEPALQPGVGGEREQFVLLRSVEPTISGLAVEPARDLVSLVVERHRKAVPANIERGPFGVGRHRGRDCGGVALVQGIPVEIRACAVFRDVAAGRPLLVESGEEGVLTLAPFRLLDPLGRVLLEVGPLVPDSGKGMVAALADRPDDHGGRPARPLDVERRVVEPRPGHEEEWTEVRILLLADPNRLAERPAAQEGKVCIGRSPSLSPEIPDVVPGIERIVG